MSEMSIQTADPDIVRDIVHALGDRPGETQARTGTASRTMSNARFVASGSRGSVETMFAGLAVTHFALIVDSARDVLRGQADNALGRGRSRWSPGSTGC